MIIYTATVPTSESFPMTPITPPPPVHTCAPCPSPRLHCQPGYDRHPQQPPGVPRVDIRPFSLGSNPFPYMTPQPYEVHIRPSVALQDQQEIFIHGVGTLRISEIPPGTSQWVMYQCYDRRSRLPRLTILIPKRWVVTTHWELVRAHLGAFWHAVKRGLSLW